MDCKAIRDLVVDLRGAELSAEAREHLSKCVACGGFLHDARVVQAGFRALAEEAAPEASLGFASRLIRRLHEWEEKGVRQEFFEAVGRRFVYATLALTLALLLSLALPTSGPVRGVAGADFLGLQAESQSAQPDVIGGDIGDSHDWIPVRLPERNR
jgi:hypothetical protein